MSGFKRIIKAAPHPTPQVGKADTSLRYTDILFGFVLKELFTRLQHFPTAPWKIRLQLVAATTLVLGSWVGYRRSLNRSAFEVKFFNLPLFRFVADQLMLICYFYVATVTDDKAYPVVPGHLLFRTTFVMVIVYVLYAIWDFLGILMAKASLPAQDGKAGLPRYYKINPADAEDTQERMLEDWLGFWITVSFLLILLLLWLLGKFISPYVSYVLLTVILLSYRTAKEIRTSLTPPQ